MASRDYSVAEKVFDEFVENISSFDVSWKPVVSTPGLAIFQKEMPAEESAVQRVKLVGKVNHPPALVEQLLFDNTLRPIWDEVVQKVEPIERLENGNRILYMATRPPSPVYPRDLVLLRVQKEIEFNKKKTVVVVDTSVEHPSLPAVEGYIRAHTIMSGAVCELQPDGGTLYSMISQLDMKGYIPVSVINMLVGQQTAKWFKLLTDACDSHAKGNLHTMHKSKSWGEMMSSMFSFSSQQ